MTPATSYSMLKKTVHVEGFAVAPDSVPSALTTKIIQKLEAAKSQPSDKSVSNHSGTYGFRNLLEVVPEVAEFANCDAVVQCVQAVLGPHAFVVRATLFDKTEGANWGVFWHQDLSIAVKDKHTIDGFRAWTRKAGVHCVQPPPKIMEKLLAIRIHLDNCTRTNGALKVLPRTHQNQRLDASAIESQKHSVAETICELPAGGILLMKPLLLHASSPMEACHHRRVIHFECAHFQLPAPLAWHTQLPIGRSDD